MSEPQILGKPFSDSTRNVSSLGASAGRMTAGPSSSETAYGTTSPARQSAAFDRVRRPAAGLLGVGLLTVLVGFGLAFWSGRVLVTMAAASAGPQTQSVGGMTWTITVNGPSEQSLVWYRVVLVTQCVAVATGLVTVAGALGMLRLRRRPLAIVGSGLAMAPISPCWIAGLPLGVWSLSTLLHADVKREFGRASPGAGLAADGFSLRQLNVAQMLVLSGCLLGFAATFIPWSSARVFVIDSVFLGFDSWHGIVTGSVCGAALAALAVLHAARSGVVGRLLASLTAGVTAIVVAIIYLRPDPATLNISKGPFSGDSALQPFGDSLVSSFTDTLKDGMGQHYLPGPYVVAAIGGLLLAVTAWQAIGLLMARPANAATGS